MGGEGAFKKAAKTLFDYIATGDYTLLTASCTGLPLGLDRGVPKLSVEIGSGHMAGVSKHVEEIPEFCLKLSLSAFDIREPLLDGLSGMVVPVPLTPVRHLLGDFTQWDAPAHPKARCRN
jgi:hypothetical protein